MRIRLWHVAVLGVVITLAILLATFPAHFPSRLTSLLGSNADIAQIREKQRPLLTAALKEKGLEFGAPVFLRLFKEDAVLELWVKRNNKFHLFHSYPICRYSGSLGPKLKEGDRQAPEGIYRVDARALNPNSSYHLSFNLGFPNGYDRAHGRTGSFLMVHGNCVSIGCYAMTDPAIEEIYVLIEAALANGQVSVPVHAFPFRFSKTRMQQAADSPWFGFWQELAAIDRAFETSRKVPQVEISGRAYRLP